MRTKLVLVVALVLSACIPTVPATPVVPATATVTSTPVATVAPVPTLAPTTVPMRYVVQRGTPRATTYFADPLVGCDWAGVGGQVFDNQHFGKIGMVVHVIGSGLNEMSSSGSHAATYGPGGWEVFIAAGPRVSVFTVRVENGLGEVLSENFVVETVDSCEVNLIIVNFVELP